TQHGGVDVAVARVVEVLWAQEVGDDLDSLRVNQQAAEDRLLSFGVVRWEGLKSTVRRQRFHNHRLILPSPSPPCSSQPAYKLTRRHGDAERGRLIAASPCHRIPVPRFTLLRP